MKWVLIIIMTSRAHTGGVDIDTVEMQTQALCEQAKQQVQFANTPRAGLLHERAYTAAFCIQAGTEPPKAPAAAPEPAKTEPEVDIKEHLLDTAGILALEPDKTCE